MIDQSDTELLQSFAQLSPLLLQASQFLRSNEDEPNPKKSQAEAPGATERGGGANPTEPDANGAPDGTGGSSARQGTPVAPSAGMLRFVRPIQPRKCSDGADAADVGMAEQDGQGAGASQVAQPPHLPPSELDPGAAAAVGEAIAKHRGAGAVGQSSLRGSYSSGRELALHEVVSFQQKNDPLTSTSDEHGQGPQGCAIPFRTVGGEWASPPISRSEATGDHCAVAPAGLHERTGGLENPGILGSVLSMDVDRSVLEGSLTTDQQACPGSGGNAAQSPAQGPWQGRDEEGVMTAETRAAFRQALLGLAFDNTGHSCFANSSMACFVWACLSRHNFMLGEWGDSASCLRDMLNHHDGLFQIDCQQWYQSLVAQWDEHRGQADSAEFTSLLMQWVDTTSCSCLWQRRWMQSENVLIHDHGHVHQPLTLQLNPVQVADGFVRLTDLMRFWHGELGMQAGRFRPKDILCVHIDRFASDPVHGYRKLQTPVIFTGKNGCSGFSRQWT